MRALWALGRAYGTPLSYTLRLCKNPLRLSSSQALQALPKHRHNRK